MLAKEIVHVLHLLRLLHRYCIKIIGNVMESFQLLNDFAGVISR